MKRREFITLLGGAAAWPLGTRAQQAEKMLRVGALSAQPRAAPIWLAFDRRIAELGYKHGTNFVLEFVQVDSIGDYERGYRELVARKVDILLATGPEIALKKIFLQKRLSHKGYPLYGTEPFLDRFLGEGA